MSLLAPKGRNPLAHPRSKLFIRHCLRMPNTHSSLEKTRFVPDGDRLIPKRAYFRTVLGFFVGLKCLLEAHAGIELLQNLKHGCIDVL